MLIRAIEIAFVLIGLAMTLSFWRLAAMTTLPRAVLAP